MKKILTILLGVLFVGLSAQTAPPTGASTTENYVYSRTYLEAVTTSSTTAKQVQSIQYFDGLGRPKQSIAIKATPKGNDLVTPIIYDGFGRQTRDYLPVPQSSTSNGALYTQNSDLVAYPVTDATNFYNSEKIYSEKNLENSPLDRVMQQYQVGNDWSTKPIDFKYEANGAGEVKKFIATFNYTTFASTLSIATASDYVDTNGFYKASQLYKNTVTDEDGNVSSEFKNGQGQTLLVRKMLGTTPVDTYYVYNDYDQLAFVIPPLAADKYKGTSYTAGTSILMTDTDLNQLCYQYKYDAQNRLVEKKLPGKGWEYMVYDKQDRLVATQDANMRLNTQWLFTKYDMFGRVAYTGIATGSTRTAEQTNADAAQSNYVERKTSIGFTQNGLEVYYGNPTNITSYPTNITTLLSVNYYDEYPTGTTYLPTTIESQTVNSKTSQGTTSNANAKISTKGLPLASFVKNIEDNGWTKTYTYYDLKARPIGTHSDNYLGGYTRTSTKLTFSGKPEYTIAYHKKADRSDITIIKETFEYDNQERLVKHWHQVNNTGNNELLAENIYNEIGQLQAKKVGGNTSTPLQTVDYQYNIRGWMTQINANADGSLQTNKLFNYRIFYNTLNPDFTGGTARYNGNIAEITWKTNHSNADDKVRNYSYEYDALNRLLSAKYFAKGTTNDQDYYNENLTYDLNGNINSLQRFSKPVSGTNAQLIDGLSYSYEGNRLTKVWDWSYNPTGFTDDSNSYDTTDDYGYDANGNMNRDDNKKMTSIKYNFLNLPTEIILPNSEKVNYTYRADGTKLKKVRIINQGGRTATETTDYIDGFQYQAFSSYTENRSSKLMFFPTAEGYYSTDIENNPSNPQYGYVYNYTDHLGNVRLSYYKNPSTGSVDVLEENNYYPFGLKHEGYNSSSVVNQSYQYKYNGKELQETGMYDYGARFYMPDIGRWGVHDPLSELQFKYSPYAYIYNNPILFNDPTGMIGKCPNGNCPPEFINEGKEKEIEEVVLTNVSPKPSKDSSISWTGIESLSAYHKSRDRLASAIRSSPSALATEQFEKNLANGIGTFFMGGSNILASSGWAAFDSWLDYQGSEVQEAIAGVQFLAILIQLRHGNIKAAEELIDDAAKTGLTNPQLVQRAASFADDFVPFTKNAGVTGTLKHQAANRYLHLYQLRNGQRGLSTNVYFNNGVGNRGFLDVLDRTNGIIYDFKFGNAVMSPAQFGKYSRNFGLPIQVIRP